MNMTNVFKPHPLIAAVLCLALVIVRVGGAHLHLCFDGTEPPVSYHAFEDGSAHELPGFDVTHQDADIALTSDMHSRLGTAFNDLPVLLSIAVMVWLLPRLRRTFVALRSVRIAHDSPSLLLPPLRGPPLPISS